MASSSVAGVQRTLLHCLWEAKARSTTVRLVQQTGTRAHLRARPSAPRAHRPGRLNAPVPATPASPPCGRTCWSRAGGRGRRTSPHTHPSRGRHAHRPGPSGPAGRRPAPPPTPKRGAVPTQSAAAHTPRADHATPPPRCQRTTPQNLAATTTRPAPRRPLRRQQALHNPHRPSPTTHNPDTRPIPHPAPPSETRPSGPGRGSPRPGGSPRCRGGRGPRRGRRRRRAPRRARPAAPRAGHGSPRGRAHGSGSG